MPDKMKEFWNCFDKTDFKSKVRCAELAGEIIPELDNLSNDAIGNLRDLVIALGSETVQHSAPVDTALRAARQFLLAEANGK